MSVILSTEPEILPPALLEPVVNVTVIYNSLDVLDRVVDQLAWTSDKTLAEYMDGLPDETEWALTVNAQAFPRVKWHDVTLKRDDWILLVPVPEGMKGGGGKMIFRLVAMIALAVVAPYIGGLIGPMLGMGAFGSTLVGGLVSIVGGFLINALLPPPKPKQKGLGETTPNYGIDGPKNTSNEDLPIPLVYGEARVAGNVIAVNTRTGADSNQDYYTAMVLSEGEIESVTDVQINDQRAGFYRGIDSQIRLGTDNQTQIGWFDDIVTLINKNTKIGTTFIQHDTTQDVDKLRVDINFPLGLAAQTNKGARTHQVPFILDYAPYGTESWAPFLLDTSKWVDETFASPVTGYYQLKLRTAFPVAPPGQTITVNVVTQYRQAGVGEWITVFDRTETYSGNTPGATQADLQADGANKLFSDASASAFDIIFDVNPALNYEWQCFNGTVTPFFLLANTNGPLVAAASQVPVRRTFETGLLPTGRYSVRLRRTTADATDAAIQDDAFWTDIGEIISDNIQYNFTALLAIRVKLSDQLNASPTITSLVKGIKCNQYDRQGNFVTKAWTDNVAWVALDILTHERYGGGMPLTRFDMARWFEWAEFCTAEGLKFNGIIDQTTNVWDGLMDVMRIGRAQIVRVGTRYGLAIEKSESPVMMFSVVNIIKDTFKQTWLPVAERANELEISFLDKTDNYKRRTIKIYDPDALNRGDPSRPTSLDLKYANTEEQAWKEGWLQMNMNRALKLTAEFEATLESIGCTVGDVVYVQHDVPQWGYAGRTAAGSTTTVIKLDRPVQMVVGTAYKLLLHYDSLGKMAGTIAAINGRSLLINAAFNPGRISRVWQDDAVNERQIDYYNYQAPFIEILVDDPTGYEVGQTAHMYETDALVERDLTGSGTFTELTVASAFPLAPAPLVNWLFGAVGQVKKPFRVIAIEGTADYKRTLKCLEYNDTIYGLPEEFIPTPNYSSLPTTIGKAVINGVGEELVIIGSVLAVRVTVQWAKPVIGLYEGAELYCSIEDGDFQQVGRTTAGGTSVTFEAQTGDRLSLYVVAVDGAGRRTVDAATEILNYTVIGKFAPPGTPTDFVARKSIGGIILEWTPNTEPDIAGYEIREGTSWDDGSIIVSDYAGTNFLAEKQTGGLLRYFIKAIDTSQIYSEVPAEVQILVAAPAQVVGFDVVQAGDKLLFQWRANTEKDIAGYEIRYGASWGNSVFLARPAGVSFVSGMVSVDAQTFWIKAVDNVGIYSERAVFSTPSLADIGNRNAIFFQDENAGGWAGRKINVSDVSGRLQLDAGVSNGEYVWQVDLGQSYRARNVASQVLTAILPGALTWEDAIRPWSAAVQPWNAIGAVGAATVVNEIAREVGLNPGQIEAWSLNGTLTGVDGTTPAESGTPVYLDNGRFFDGLNITDATVNYSWGVTTTAQFNTSFWVVANSTPTGTITLASMSGTSGDLNVQYDTATEIWTLVGSDGNTLTTGAMELVADRRYLVNVGQTASERRLYVGEYDTGLIVSSDGLFAPIGAMDSVRLYETV